MIKGLNLKIVGITYLLTSCYPKKFQTLKNNCKEFGFLFFFAFYWNLIACNKVHLRTQSNLVKNMNLRYLYSSQRAWSAFIREVYGHLEACNKYTRCYAYILTSKNKLSLHYYTNIGIRKQVSNWIRVLFWKQNTGLLRNNQIL